MIQRRHWLIKFSVLINLLVIVYVASQLVITSHRGAALAGPGEAEQLVLLGAGEASRRILLDIGSQPPSYSPNTHTQGPSGSPFPTNRTHPVTTDGGVTPKPTSAEPFMAATYTNNFIQCSDVEPRSYTAQRGDYWVLHNYVLPSRSFRCWESITYTTHADYTFLDNLEPLLERWRGPISVAVFAPGTDFDATLESIRYLRDCTRRVSELVTFHVYFPSKHFPKAIPRGKDRFTPKTDCKKPAPWVKHCPTYKLQKKLLYPVNVGRNIAREAATTHYVLASDIELYPSPGVINSFLDMVRRQDPPLRHNKPKVFPLSIFEIEANMRLPADKTELVTMLKNGSAIPFHKKVCAGCHNVPRSKDWLKTNSTSGLHVFHIGKRTGLFVHWEPIYIGTHSDPLYDERLSWEGKSDKMTQGYILCVLDYEFQILDNAFLVHKPGIKTLKKDPARAMLAGKTNSLIRLANA